MLLRWVKRPCSVRVRICDNVRVPSEFNRGGCSVAHRWQCQGTGAADFSLFALCSIPFLWVSHLSEFGPFSPVFRLFDPFLWASISSNSRVFVGRSFPCFIRAPSTERAFFMGVTFVTFSGVKFPASLGCSSVGIQRTTNGRPLYGRCILAFFPGSSQLRAFLICVQFVRFSVALPLLCYGYGLFYWCLICLILAASSPLRWWKFPWVVRGWPWEMWRRSSVFRPCSTGTRGPFVTALSRLQFWPASVPRPCQ